MLQQTEIFNEKNRQKNTVGHKWNEMKQSKMNKNKQYDGIERLAWKRTKRGFARDSKHKAENLLAQVMAVRERDQMK